MTKRASVTKGRGSGGRRTLATRVDVLGVEVENLRRRMASQEKREKARDAETAEKFALMAKEVSNLGTGLGLLGVKVGNIQSVTRDTWECMDKLREGQKQAFGDLTERLDTGLAALHTRLNSLGCAPTGKEDGHA